MSGNGASFRGDLEFLRGIAVALVVLFHLKINVFKSGFIGVDVFFVLSGFLMAAALQEANKTTVLQFYERRARRILPAAYITFFIIFICSPFLFLPFETAKVTEAFLAAIFCVPNVLYWEGNDYFSDLEFRPMLHYWSLGVELQYYMVFPAIVFVFRKMKIFFLVLLLLSFSLSIYLTATSLKGAFFMLPGRLWEFLFGYFAFQLSTRPLPIKSNYRNLLAVLCLAVVIAAALFPIPLDKFPGFYAVAPVLFSALFIVFGFSSENAWLAKFAQPIRFLGKYSYSIYLIHFPVIFIFVYGPFSTWKPLSGLTTIVAVAVTLLLSVLSYHFVEEPFRNKKAMPLQLLKKITLGFFVVSLLLVAVFYLNNFFSWAYPKQQQEIFFSINDQAYWRCSRLQRINEYGSKSCFIVKNPQATKRLLLAGDSHMDAIKLMFADEAQTKGAELRFVHASCSLGKGHCTSSILLDEIQRYKITDLVLHGYVTTRFDYQELDLLISKAKDLPVKLHFIDPVPTYKDSIPKAVYFNDTATLNTHSPYNPDLDISEQYKAFELRHQEESNVYFYHPDQYFCDQASCRFSDDNGIYYFDSHHLTLTGAKALAPIAQEILDK